MMEVKYRRLFLDSGIVASIGIIFAFVGIVLGLGSVWVIGAIILSTGLLGILVTLFWAFLEHVFRVE
jgi:hypothetical protein